MSEPHFGSTIFARWREAAVSARLGTNPSANPRWQALIERFRTTTRRGVGFWDMGLRGAA